MSPRHFSDAMFRRHKPTQSELEMEAKIEHAIAFAFSPAVFHPIKTVGRLRRFFKRGSQSKNN